MSHKKIAVEEQKKASIKLKKYLLDDTKEILFTGPAGTGKTTMLINLVKDGTILSESTIFTAISHKALIVLKNKFEESGFKEEDMLFTTISKLLNKVPGYDNKGNLIFKRKFRHVTNYNSFKLLIIDESSMIDDKTYHEIMNFCNRNNLKVLFTGDINQCPPPSGNDTSKVFKIKKHVELTTPYRYGKDINQVAIELRDLLKKKTFTNQDLINVFKTINSNPDVTIYNDKASWIKNAIDNAKTKDSIVLAYRNETVKKLSAYMRDQIIEFPEIEYQIDDILICEKPHENKMVVTKAITSELYKVRKINSFNIDLVYDKNGTEIVITWSQILKLPFINDSLNSLCNGKQIHSIKFHELHLTQINNNKYIHSYVIDKNYVEVYEEYKKEVLAYYNKLKTPTDAQELEMGRLCNRFSEYNYGYAINIYKSQGSTYDEVFIYLDDILELKPVSLIDKCKAIYTALTRAKTRVHILLTK
jgi:ATP-dependent exoDNAse (exonuclease V) alpha subunit